MAKRRIPLAIAYDFDGTLAPGNMQEYDFVPALGMSKRTFWKEVEALAAEHDADPILMYMKHMLDRAEAAQVPVRKGDFVEFGRSVQLFAGVESWFERIDDYGSRLGLKVEHFIISSGIREMIEGTPIGRKFAAVYASSFVYDHHGVARWPALAVNYTTKTQFLFRINKGVLQVHDNHRINEFVAKHERPVPFENMVFVGDGDTDIPCFRLVKDQGGHAIAVYKPNTRGARKRAEKLVGDGRVNFIAPANYREGGEMELILQRVLEKVAADGALLRLGKRG